MKTRLIKLLVITLGTMVLSYCTTAPMMWFLLGFVPKSAVIASLLVPVIAGAPIAFYLDTQKHRARVAMAELEAAQQQLKQLNEELQRQASRDYLTGVLNRRHFFTNINVEWQTTISGALMCIDLDNFKTINDSFGHAVGDVALKKIAQGIVQVVGRDDVVARIGGEEFVVYLPHATEDEAIAMAETIRQTIAAIELRPNEDVVHPMSVSIGLSFLREADSLDGLVNLSDQRMYQAKWSGKNRVVHTNQSDLLRDVGQKARDPRHMRSPNAQSANAQSA